jgi:23S rRNA pseudouridine2605 synthase
MVRKRGSKKKSSARRGAKKSPGKKSPGKKGAPARSSASGKKKAPARGGPSRKKAAKKSRKAAPGKRAAKKARKASPGRKAGKKASKKRFAHTQPGKARAPKRGSSASQVGTVQGSAPEAGGSGLWDRILEQARGSEDAKGLVRLNAFLARCGLGSRRSVEELIEQGRVNLNGQRVRDLGTKVDPLRDEVDIDGERLQPEKPVYVVLHKPKGVVCTNASAEQKTRAIDLIPHVKGRVFPVGRLDLDSEGLLLLTNDGGFAERMTHPRYGVPKTYRVTLRGSITDAALEKTRGGVWLAEGRTGHADVRIARRSKERTVLLVTIREGKNREIRRIFGRVGYPVLRLQRVQIGPLEIKGLRKGLSRFLRPAEVEGLLEATEPDA